MQIDSRIKDPHKQETAAMPVDSPNKLPEMNISDETKADIKKSGEDFEKSMEALHAKEKPEPEGNKEIMEGTNDSTKKPGTVKKVLIALGVVLAAVLGFKFFLGKKK